MVLDNYWPIPTSSVQFILLRNLKNLGFSVFLGKVGDFFFQNAILCKIGPRTIKNGFYKNDLPQPNK
jgi:hypothetical protein